MAGGGTGSGGELGGTEKWGHRHTAAPGSGKTTIIIVT